MDYQVLQLLVIIVIASAHRLKNLKPYQKVLICVKSFRKLLALYWHRNLQCRLKHVILTTHTLHNNTYLYNEQFYRTDHCVLQRFSFQYLSDNVRLRKLVFLHSYCHRGTRTVKKGVFRNTFAYLFMYSAKLNNFLTFHKQRLQSPNFHATITLITFKTPLMCHSLQYFFP